MEGDWLRGEKDFGRSRWLRNFILFKYSIFRSVTNAAENLFLSLPVRVHLSKRRVDL